MPGRKSDVNDATWIADLLAHGLIRSSFVPPAPIQDLRALTRTRKQLVRELAQQLYDLISSAHDTLTDPTEKARYVAELEQGVKREVLGPVSFVPLVGGVG